MNPFTDSQRTSARTLLGRVARLPAWFLFLVCLVLGGAFVTARTVMRTDARHAHAHAAALARANALELQLRETVTAAELLAALARQSGGGLSNFPQLAAEVLSSHPGLAWVGLEPGGVVTDLFPRAGQESAIGFNVLKDPTQRPAAFEAIQKRVLTVVAPVRLLHGEAGIAARAPVFQRAREGGELFWGFISASMRVTDAIAQAQVGDLAAEGFDYVLYAPGEPGRKAVTIASRGTGSFRNAVQEPVLTNHLELFLAVQPHGGRWVNLVGLLFELVVVVLLSALLCAVPSLFEGRRLAAEKNGTAVAQAGAKLAEVETRLEEAARVAQDRVERAESKAAETQSKLDSTVRSAAQALQAKQTELEQALQELGERRVRAEQAGGTERATIAAAAARHQQDQATIANLQTRLETASRLQRDEAEKSNALVKRLEAGNNELKKRLLAAEQVGEQVTDLTARLNEAQAELQRLQAAAATAASAPPASPKAAPPEAAPPVAAEPAAPVPPSPPEPVPATPIPAQAAEPAPMPPPAKRTVKPGKRQRARCDPQMDFFSVPATTPPAGAPLKADAGAVSVEEPAEAPNEAASSSPPSKAPTPNRPAPARRLPPAPPVNPAQLRKAVNELLPLLTEQDPGARDCLKANRATFRSGFSPEAFVEFEQMVQGGDFLAALEQLKRAGRKHGLPV